MNSKPLFKHLLFVGISLVPLLYMAAIWKSIPETVPTHFGVDMKPDDYSSRTGFFFMEGFLSLLSIGLYFLLLNLHRIDPKRANKPLSPVFGKLAMGIVIFMTALSFITIRISLGYSMSGGKLMFPLLGLLFAFLGNMMYNVKPNYFVGVRIPWTLSSDYNWRKTHQLTGKLWFAGGLALAVISFFLPLEVDSVAMMATIGILVIIPIAYSFRLYKKEQKDPSIATEERENQ